jgi:hypothetical protein
VGFDASEPSSPEADAIVRSWPTRATSDAASVVIDGSWYGAAADSPIEVQSVEINDLFSAGARVAFHVSQRGSYRGGLAGVDAGFVGRETTLRCVGLARVQEGEVREVRVITDRFGARHELIRGAV